MLKDRHELLAVEVRAASVRYHRSGKCTEPNDPLGRVRNYQARNFLRDGLRLGDQAFFHSGTTNPAIVGIVEVVRAGYPDETAFDSESLYHDSASTPDRPRWYRVDVRLVRRLRRAIALAS